MRSSVARTATSLLLAYSVFCSLAFSQQPTQQETRPRRAGTAWPQPSAAVPVTLPSVVSVTGPEPTIRVALATDTRSAVISTTSKLMSANGPTFVSLATSRVRLEPRLLSPIPALSDDNLFRVMVAGAVSREEAEENSKEIKTVSGEDVQIGFDTDLKKWVVVVGSKKPKQEADEAVARLESAGIDATIVDIRTNAPLTPMTKESSGSLATSTPPLAGSSNIRLASHTSLPSREVIAFASGANKLFSSSAPVSFASDDEKISPVRYNDRPYRGRIEVFTNSRGTLTIVNELPLEDYVRGVVPNELSSGGYPAFEALKAQAIAARTYALKNRGQFLAQGFDLLPTTRSQVYRGLTSENSLASRAVDETRGLIATYNGEPINALYTSTCGGHTEDAENIFNESIPYLRGRECAAEGESAFTPFMIQTTREPAELRELSNLALARDISLLTVQNFSSLPARVSDSWLASPANAAEVRNWIANVYRLSHQPALVPTDDVVRPPAFATTLAVAVLGDSRPSTLFNDADSEYLLAVKDAREVPSGSRADLALLIRDGFLMVYPDATIRPREPLSRARVLHAIARMLEAHNFLQMQRANARTSAQGQLVLRTTKGKDQPIRVTPDAFLFRQIGESSFGVKSVALVGGEPVIYHLAGSGEVDYLEVKPAPNGAAADRMSPFSNWTTGLSLSQVQSRLSRYSRGIGQVTNLQVVSRGSSHRVTDLELVGTAGTAHIRGGRIRSALGLREQLFVIDRNVDDTGRITSFVFTGRGWGHGVGMCQVGAYGLAKQGYSAEQILKSFYTGIELTKLY